MFTCKATGKSLLRDYNVPGCAFLSPPSGAQPGTGFASLPGGSARSTAAFTTWLLQTHHLLRLDEAGGSQETDSGRLCQPWQGSWTDKGGSGGGWLRQKWLEAKGLVQKWSHEQVFPAFPFLGLTPSPAETRERLPLISTCFKPESSTGSPVPEERSLLPPLAQVRAQSH